MTTSTHTHGGVGNETFVNCPYGLLYGPSPDAESEFTYCPYCGNETTDTEHRVDTEIAEVFCDNTIMSTYRFCPNCGESLEDED